MSADTFAVSTSGEDLKNRFSAVAIEDTDEALDLAAAEVATSNLGEAKKSQAKDRSVEIYELEGQSDIDNAFTIFCFLRGPSSTARLPQGDLGPLQGRHM